MRGCVGAGQGLEADVPHFDRLPRPPRRRPHRHGGHPHVLLRCHRHRSRRHLPVSHPRPTTGPASTTCPTCSASPARQPGPWPSQPPRHPRPPNRSCPGRCAPGPAASTPTKPESNCSSHTPPSCTAATSPTASSFQEPATPTTRRQQASTGPRPSPPSTPATCPAPAERNGYCAWQPAWTTAYPSTFGASRHECGSSG